MAARFLAGKVALVTGSTSGIGAGIARSLGRAGANLVINGLIKDAEGEALRKQFEKELGVKVGLVQCVGWKHGAKVNRAAAPNRQGARC
jgi:3-hydroxybutyrate dehydrogenase